MGTPPGYCRDGDDRCRVVWPSGNNRRIVDTLGANWMMPIDGYLRGGLGLARLWGIGRCGGGERQ